MEFAELVDQQHPPAASPQSFLDVSQLVQLSIQIVERASWAIKLNLANSFAQCRWSGIGARSRITTRPRPKLGNWLGRRPRQ